MAANRAAADVPRWLRTGTLLLVAGALIAGWGPRLLWGLWLDETFTAWQAEAGWAGIWPGKLTNPGQSALFAYVEAPFYFPHSSHMELWLRVPALAGAVASCFLVFRLTELLVGKGTGFLAVIAFAGNPSLLFYATQARPYTLALAACLASLWGLLRWLDTGARRHGLTFAVTLAVMIHLHIMFTVFVLVPALFVIDRARRGLPVSWRGLARWLGVTLVLLLPLIPLLADFVTRRAGLSPFRLPGLAELAQALLPGSILFSSVAFLILLALTRDRRLEALRDPRVRSLLPILLCWLALPPLIFFAASHVIHQAVLGDRFFLHTVAAQALIVAAAFRGFPPVLARIGLLACFVPFLIIWGVRDWRAADGPASWRRPFDTARALDPSASAPVFVQAGHPMANSIDWPHAVEQRSFVYSPVTTYPLPNHIYPVPYTLDDRAMAYVRRAADAELADSPLIFVAGMPVHPMMKWLRQFFESRGYTGTLAVDEVVGLLVLRKPIAP